MKKSLYTLALFTFSISIGLSQTSKIEQLKTVVQPSISISQLDERLEEITLSSYMPCHAIDFPVNLSVNNAEHHGNSYFWKFAAEGMSIKAFLEIESLPLGDTLFALNEQGNALEYLTHSNYRQKKWSTLESNDLLVLHYKGSKPNLKIKSYSLGRSSKKAEDFGDSQFCEVNVNCSEGNNYQDIKNSVVRILTKIGSAYFWCTGSIINNTSFDHTPYLLSAEHCALNASNFADSTDLSNWEFYFHYESQGCTSPASEGNLANNKITGAFLRAHSHDNGGDTGSDFLLLELDLSFNNGVFPPSIDPYFAGWSRADVTSSSGVCIHHPEGDLKKISTSTTPSVSGEYGTTMTNTHWLVTWSQTQHGHGVTEGGSSGSPYLNGNKQIVGTLTGGYASCSFNTGEDFYGKFSYHWDQNGTSASYRLKDWLDPQNTGALTLSGATLSDSAPPYEEKVLSIAPNPVRLGKLYINGLYTVGDITIQIYNLQGNMVYPRFSDRPSIDIAEGGYIPVDYLPNGPYILRLINGNDAQTIKFIKLD